MNLDEVELHDAILTSSVTDYDQQTVAIGVKYYKGPEDRDRSSAKLLFESVSAFHQIVDLDVMKENLFAGQVNHWRPATNGGTTYIYLVDGCLAITSRTIKLLPE